MKLILSVTGFKYTFEIKEYRYLHDPFKSLGNLFKTLKRVDTVVGTLYNKNWMFQKN